MKMNYLLVLFLVIIGLTAAVETQENLLDDDDVDLKMIPPFIIDWINQGYNWVCAHGPQITQYIQNKINNIPITEAIKDWVKSKLGAVGNWVKKSLSSLVITALKKVLKK